MSDTVVFFSPYSNYVAHSELEHFLANELVKLGNRVIVLRCATTLGPKCLGMKMRDDSPENRAEGCSNCLARTQILSRRALYASASLHEYLGGADYELADTLISGGQTFDWQDFEFEGVPFGKLWSYTPALHFKTARFDQHPEALQDFWESARGNLLSYFAARNFSATVKPDAAVVYAFEYPANRSFLLGLDNVPGFSVNNAAGFLRHSAFEVSGTLKFKDPFLEFRMAGSTELPLSEQEVRIIAKNIFLSMAGKNLFSYSPPVSTLSKAQVISRLKLDPGKPIVLFLLSSPDELDAGNLALLRPEHRKFDDELDLVRVVDPLAKAMPDVQFLVRLHPRLFVESRVRKESDRLEELLSLLPETSNVVVNKPEDGLGLFDVAKIADVAVSTRSSSAWEFGAMGIPVVFTDPTRDPTRPIEFSIQNIDEGSSSYTINELVRRIEFCINGKVSLRGEMRVARFFADLTVRTAIPLYRGHNTLIATFLSTLRRSLFLWLSRAVRRRGDFIFRRKSVLRHIQFSLESMAYRYGFLARLPRIQVEGAVDLLKHLSNWRLSHESSDERERAAIDRMRRKLFRKLSG